MHTRAFLSIVVTLVGCSSAADLPLGGPYGGTMSGDASVGSADAPTFVLTDGGVLIGTGTGTGTGFGSGTGAGGGTGTGTGTGT
jgi:hypothetical protein